MGYKRGTGRAGEPGASPAHARRQLRLQANLYVHYEMPTLKQPLKQAVLSFLEETLAQGNPLPCGGAGL